MKLIENCTLDELKLLLQNDISYEIIEIVYDYFHRNKDYNIQVFANTKHISVATLYRYINKTKYYYERHLNDNEI